MSIDAVAALTSGIYRSRSLRSYAAHELVRPRQSDIVLIDLAIG